jgi:hypothetical protein
LTSQAIGLRAAAKTQSPTEKAKTGRQSKTAQI